MTITIKIPAPAITLSGGNTPITLNLKERIAVSPILAGVGIKGDKGETGGSQLTYRAGANISGHTAVYLGADGFVYPASPLLHSPIVGVTIASAVLGTDVQVQSIGGISMIGWVFEPNSPVFVQDNGSLSTTVSPNAVYNTVVGIANSATSMVVGVQPQIKLN